MLDTSQSHAQTSLDHRRLQIAQTLLLHLHAQVMSARKDQQVQLARQVTLDQRVRKV